MAGSGGAVPPRTLAVLRESRAPELPFDPCHHLFWANPSRSVAFAAWQDTLDDCGIGSHWHRADGRLTAFTGLVWPRNRPWDADRPWASQLADYLKTHPLADGTHGLLGVFTAASLDHAGRGVVASDPLGLGLVYMGENPAVSVLSTRANLAARLLAAESTAPPPRDAFGACWLAYSPYPIGPRTGFEGVEVAPIGARVEIDPARGLRLRRPAQQPWRDRPPEDRDRRALVGELRADIATSIRAALALPVPNHLADLTGGKDSRLILAVMLDEGLAHEFEFRTFGAPDLPDVVIANRIADTFGLRHGVNVIDRRAQESRATLDAAIRKADYGTVPRREVTMRLSVGSWFGMRGVFEPQLARPPHGDSVLLSGACGGVLRTAFPATGRFRSMRELEQFPRSDLRFAASGILRPEAEEHYDREVRRAVFDDFADEDVPQDAVDAFYIRNRLRRWLGTRQEVDQANRVFPLYAFAGVRAAFAIGAEDRHAEWLHFEITRQACEPLARLPFDRGGWHKHLMSNDAHTGDQDRAVAAPSSARRRQSTGSQGGGGRSPRVRTALSDRRQRLEPTDLEIMRRYLVEDRSNPVFDYVEREAVATALDRFDELSEPAKRQIYGALTAAMWLGRMELPMRPSSLA